MPKPQTECLPENASWIVTIDHPYYPEIEYYPSEVQASSAIEYATGFHRASAGQHDCIITKAEIKKSVRSFKCDY